MSNILLIGTRRYSSWSLRGWLAVRLAGLDVVDEVIQLKGADQTEEIHRRSPNGLVPYLQHDGAKLWESLAIGEYCAEFKPSLWPAERIARAEARSLAAQMHAGFKAIRQALPMNLGRDGVPRETLDAATLDEIATLDRLWSETRHRFGDGPFLFGADFTIADVMFAPVVTRFHSYAIVLSERAQAYADAVRAHPLMMEWARLAAQEPESWRLERYEALA